MCYQPAADGILEPKLAVRHRNDEYDERGFESLKAMQEQHFWYRGRHRFLLHALRRHARSIGENWKAVDLGGGTGGWIQYLVRHGIAPSGQLALADSSRRALQLAGDVLPTNVSRYQIDATNLGWREEWDAAFLLDVIEHLPDDTTAMREAGRALKPGGLLFVTTPAFQQLWSLNDDMAHHLRRYRRRDFEALASRSGLRLIDSRYFMFFLSPLYWLARNRPGLSEISPAQQQQAMEAMHQVPSRPLNLALPAVFAVETPLGHWLRFPVGTSVLGVFQKPMGVVGSHS